LSRTNPVSYQQDPVFQIPSGSYQQYPVSYLVLKNYQMLRKTNWNHLDIMEFLFLVCYDMHFSLYCPWLETFCINMLSVPEKNKKE